MFAVGGKKAEGGDDPEARVAFWNALACGCAADMLNAEAGFKARLLVVVGEVNVKCAKALLGVAGEVGVILPLLPKGDCGGIGIELPCCALVCGTINGAVSPFFNLRICFSIPLFVIVSKGVVSV